MGLQDIFLVIDAVAVTVDQRDRDSERRSFLLFALRLDRSVHQFNEALGQGHAQTCAPIAVRAG